MAGGVKKVKVGKQSTRANFAPNTFDEKTRSIDVVFATTTPVLKYDYSEGYFYEVLDMDGHDMSRASGSLPVLNDHNKYTGVEGIIGRAENIRKENGVWMATLRFSKRDDVEEIVQDIKDGILQDISFGYNVRSYEATPLAEGVTIPTYIARSWQTTEITLVVIPADPNAKIRGQESDFTEIEIINKQDITKNQNIMKREEIIALLKKRGITVADDISDTELTATLERSLTAAPAEPPAGTPPANNDEAIRSATGAERTRITTIVNECRSHKLPEEFSAKLIADGKDIATARGEIIAEIARLDADGAGARGAHTADITIGHEATEKLRTVVENALEHRANPSVKLIEGASDFRNMSLLELGKDFLIRGGMSDRQVRLLTKREVAQLSMGSSVRGYHSTSDLPNIFGNTINRSLMRAYELAAPTWKPFVSTGTMADFRETTRVRLSQLVGGFEKIEEGGEYQSVSLTDGKEVYKLVKYGQMIAFTWESMVNDDLSALSRIPRAIANKAAQKQSDLVYSILLDNPLMGDAVALFASGHGNLAAAPAAIAEVSMSAARKAMREQKDLNGEDFLNIVPKYLVVGPAYETAAVKLMNATIVAATTATTNVFKGYCEVIVEPRITDNSWFLIGDPNQYDTIEVSTLEGESALFTEQRQGFEVDGIQIKARMVFAAKALDYKAMYKVPNA